MTWLPPAAQWILLIALSAGIGAFLLWLHAPAALMLGPLIAAMMLAAGGGRVRFPLPPFVLAQGIIGCLIARMVPLTIIGDILDHWLLFTAGVLFVVAASSLLGWLMTRLQILPGTTALWGALVAKVFGVSASQGPAAIVWFPPIAWLPLTETLALAVAGPLVARALRIPAGAFLVPMVAGIVLTHFGWLAIELPAWLLAASYALVGWNIGLRFTRPLLIHAARALPRIVGCTVLLIALCGLVALMLVYGAGVDPLTAYLATSPGGSDSIAIIAASTDVDVSFVMAMQTVRMIAVLFLAPVLTKFIAERVSWRDDRPP